ISVATAEVTGIARITAKAPNSTDHRDGDERDERRQADRLPIRLGIHDVALELPNDDEPKQCQGGNVHGLGDTDCDHQDGADERPDHRHDLHEPDEAADQQPVVQPTKEKPTARIAPPMTTIRNFSRVYEPFRWSMARYVCPAFSRSIPARTRRAT